jgi:hypothetical protein
MPLTIEFSKRYTAQDHHKDIKTCDVNKMSFLTQTPVVKLRFHIAVRSLVGAFLGGCNAAIPVESESVYFPGNPNSQSAG